MSHQAQYNWTSAAARHANTAYASPQPTRRTASNIGASYSAYPSSSTMPANMDPHLQATRRAMSASSSLAGAMGEDSPSPEMAWSPSPEHHDLYTAGHPSGMTYNAPPTTNYIPYQDIMSNTMSSTPESLSPVSPNMQQAHQYAYHQQHSTPTMQPVPGVTVKVESSPPSRSSTTSSGRYAGRPEDELRALRKKVHELELVNQSSRLRVQQLEQELARGGAVPSGASTSARAYQRAIPSGLAGLPTPADSPLSSPSFQASWAARTDARIKQFCSLNRAGNALCSWHETRRERRAYPPRAAPPGYLNCGCTFEEALFEESLARHGVGSYHPGESVRMDPALRNPLLQLLQKRYGYRDGDFELDPTSGTWQEGEGPLYWEQRALLGVSSKRARTTD